jgi:hypothetical protein
MSSAVVLALAALAAAKGGAENLLAKKHFNFDTTFESLVERAPAIVYGPVKGYARIEIQGEMALPMSWVATGTVERPQVLKGPAMSHPVRFRRIEMSRFLSPSFDVPLWISALGNIEPGDDVVLFLDGKTDEVLLTIPSGSGKRDLIPALWFVATIQKLAPDRRAQIDAWNKHLSDTRVETQEMALRSLLKLTRNWADVGQALGDSMARADPEFRQFAFHAITKAIEKGHWKDTVGPVGFLCSQLEQETDVATSQLHLLAFLGLQAFADVDRASAARRSLKARLASCRRPGRL